MGTAAQAFTLTARKSLLLKVSKSTNSSKSGSTATFSKSIVGILLGATATPAVVTAASSAAAAASASCLAFAATMPALALPSGRICGEQQHVADARLVGEQHHHAVDADTDAARRGHAVLKGAHVVLVSYSMASSSPPAFSSICLAKTLRLIHRIVELGECVGVLMAGDHELKTCA